MIARVNRSSRTAVLILLSIVVTGSLAATAASAGASSARATKLDVTVLFDRAVAKVRAKPDFAKAVMLEAEGRPAGDRAVESAKKIVDWEFVLDNQDTRGSPFASVSLSYKRSSGFGSVQGHKSPFLDDLLIKKAPRMTLKDAVSLLEDAGYRDGFFNVTLRNPLGPDSSSPLYIFEVAGHSFVSVNTKTEAVAGLS